MIHYSLRTLYLTRLLASVHLQTMWLCLFFRLWTHWLRRFPHCLPTLLVSHDQYLIGRWMEKCFNENPPQKNKTKKKQQWPSLMVPASFFFFFFCYTFLFLLQLSSSFIVCSIRHAGPFQPQIKQNRRPKNRFIDHHFSCFSFLSFIYFFSSNE